MQDIKLNVLTQAQYQFLEPKDPQGFYDDRTRQQLYSLIDQLKVNQKQCSKEESLLHKRFQEAEFGILLPGDQTTEGPLKFKASLCVNGIHKGNIISGGTLIVNTQGVVYGDIMAEEVICKGKLAGKVTAGRKLQVYSTGVLVGDVVAPAVQIAPGAMFKGNCKLGNIIPRTRALPREPASGKKSISQLFGVG